MNNVLIIFRIYFILELVKKQYTIINNVLI